MQSRHLRIAEFVATLVAASAATLGLISRATPDTEAVRLRNSLIASPGTAADFDWVPGASPPGYHQETTATISPVFREFVLAASAERPPQPVGQGSEVGSAIRLAAALSRQGRQGQALQGDTLATFSTIVATGGGYCADYTQVFNALAYVADIPVREWGMSFDGFGGDGHAFNEIYDRGLRKWVMLDVFHRFYPADAASGRPLSALEFRSRLDQIDVLDTTAIVPIGPRSHFRQPEDAIAYYRRGQFGYYLWWGNDALSYDQHPVLTLAGRVSLSARQALAIVAGIHPQLRILPAPENRRAILALSGVRRSLLLHLAVIVLLIGLGALQLLALRRAKFP